MQASRGSPLVSLGAAAGSTTAAVGGDPFAALRALAAQRRMYSRRSNQVAATKSSSTSGSGARHRQAHVVTLNQSDVDGPLQPAQIDSTAIDKRLSMLRNRLGSGRVSVSMEGETVVLSGAAPSESRRRLVERLVRLEPGVGKVENRIVVDANKQSGSVEPSRSRVDQ